jgi:deazaflavin-dependent oxidoreductase (nitroreductase family)
MLVYPEAGWRRWLFRAPLHMWRFGAGPLLRNKMLILGTIGRRSGQTRHTALEYSVLDGVHYIGSGWGMRPDWCRNLAANPRASVQSRLGTQAVIARRATSEEEFRRLYHLIRGASPVWAEYLTSHGIEDNEEDFVAKRDRLVTWRLEPADDARQRGGAPQPLGADRAWVPVVAAIGVIAAIAFTAC